MREFGTSPYPVSAEASGRLRLLWTAIAADAARVEAAVRAVPPALASDVSGAFNKRARQSLDRIVALIPAELVFRAKREAAWRYLRPAPAGDLAEIVVMGAFLGASGPPRFTTNSFGLSATRHALGRLLDRSGMAADPAKAVLQAHAALLALTPSEGEAAFALPDITLPAAGGVFLASPRRDGVRAVCRTWLGAGQLWDEQEAAAAKWAELVGGDA